MKNDPQVLIVVGILILIGAVLSFFWLRYSIKNFFSLMNTGTHPADPKHILPEFWRVYEMVKNLIFILSSFLLFIFACVFGVAMLYAALFNDGWL
tara:strand:+ start:18 stop:302 length:285 start_codon:yes stop_codon:yes gene_type:complete